MPEEIYKALEKKRKKFYKSLPGALTFEDPEDVHQLRVAGRTVLSLMDMLAAPDERSGPGFRKLRRPLKNGMSLLGDLRDADVMIDEIGQRLPAMTPARRNLLEGWLEEHRDERRRLRRKAARKLPELIDGRWNKRMALWQREKAAIPVDESALRRKLDELREARAQAIRAVGEQGPGPIGIDDDERLNRLHHARIATKKLRYAIESLAPLIGPDEAELARLKAMQDRLGHVQDLRTWARKLQCAGGDRRVIAGVLKAWQSEMNETLRQADLSAES